MLKVGIPHDYVQSLQEIDMEIAMLTQYAHNTSLNDEPDAELLNTIANRLKGDNSYLK